LNVNEFGEIDIFNISNYLKGLYVGYYYDENFNDKYIITVCGANNEIGTIQLIHAIKNVIETYNQKSRQEYCRNYNMNMNEIKDWHKQFIFHVDGTQMLPYMKIDVQDLGVDMMTFSGAKIGCPSGIGFVYIKENRQKSIEPLIYGEQERGLRGGTENVPYILGLGRAMQLLDTDTSHLESLRDYFINKLLTLPNTKLVGSRLNRLPNNVNICFGNIDATALLSYLNLNGIYASSGSACNSNSLEPSHVLKEIGLSDVEANSCVRFTLSNETTVEELEEVFSVIERFVTRQNKYLGKGE
jgi:cysteine desulfurase